MTEPGGTSGGDSASGDDRAPDEQAVAAMFAALVQGAPPSGVSPLEVIRLGRDDRRAALDARIRRLKIGRNVLLAAAFAAVVALVVPHLGGGSTNSQAGSGSSSGAGGTIAAAGRAPAGAADTRTSAGSAAGGAASGSTPVSGAVSGSAPEAGSSAAAASEAAGSGSAADSGSSTAQRSAAAARSSAASGSANPAAQPPSAAASSGAAAAPPVPTSSRVDPDVPDVTGLGTGQCPVLPAAAVAAARAAFPTGSFGSPAGVSRCAGLFGAALSAAGRAETVVIVVRRAAVGACRGDVAPACSPVVGVPGVYRSAAGSTVKTWVYGRGLEVRLVGSGARTAGSPDRLIAAGRAVISALG